MKNLILVLTLSFSAISWGQGLIYEKCNYTDIVSKADKLHSEVLNSMQEQRMVPAKDRITLHSAKTLIYSILYVKEEAKTSEDLCYERASLSFIEKTLNALIETEHLRNSK